MAESGKKFLHADYDFSYSVSCNIPIVSGNNRSNVENLMPDDKSKKKRKVEHKIQRMQWGQP